jgi:ParB family chromosome partitioning protein
MTMNLTMALVENIQRHDLDPISILPRLIDEIIDSGTNEWKKTSPLPITCVFKTGSNHQTGIRDGFISMGHGRAIINEKI